MQPRAHTGMCVDVGRTNAQVLACLQWHKHGATGYATMKALRFVSASILYSGMLTRAQKLQPAGATAPGAAAVLPPIPISLFSRNVGVVFHPCCSAVV